MSRVVLLLVLPLVLVVLYVEGQNYDPELLAFRRGIFQTDSGWLPHKLGSWKLKGSPEVYTPENLYEYLNGHAEFYISRGLRKLFVGEYRRADSATTVRVEIFRMEEPLQAWALLQEQRPREVLSLKDKQGFSTEDMSVFIKGPFFVRLFSEASREDLLDRVYESLKAEHACQVLSGLLPEGARNLRYINQAYMGIEALDRIIEAEVSYRGKDITLFVRTSTETDVLKQALTEMASNGASVKKSPQGYLVEDPYEGRILLLLRDRTLYGFKGPVSLQEVSELVRKWLK